MGSSFKNVPGIMLPEYSVFKERCLNHAIMPRVIVKGDKVAGFVRVEISPDGAGEISILGRHPEFRGQRLGDVLLGEGLRILLERQAKKISLEVAATNKRALSIYESAGFGVVHETRIFRKLRNDF